MYKKHTYLTASDMHKLTPQHLNDAEPAVQRVARPPWTRTQARTKVRTPRTQVRTSSEAARLGPLIPPPPRVAAGQGASLSSNRRPPAEHFVDVLSHFCHVDYVSKLVVSGI